MALVKVEKDLECNESDMRLYKPEESLKQVADIKPDVLAIEQENCVPAKSEEKIVVETIPAVENEDQKGKEVALTKTSQTQKDGRIKKRTVHKISVRTDIKLSLMFLQEAIERAPLSDTIENSCRWECPKCRRGFGDRSLFRWHLNDTAHAVLWHGNDNYLTDIVAFKCHICSKKILCDESVFYYHLYREHDIKISFTDFAKRYIYNSEDDVPNENNNHQTM